MSIGNQFYYSGAKRFHFNGYMDEIRYTLGAKYVLDENSGIGSDDSGNNNYFTTTNFAALDIGWDSAIKIF